MEVKNITAVAEVACNTATPGVALSRLPSRRKLALSCCAARRLRETTSLFLNGLAEVELVRLHPADSPSRACVLVLLAALPVLLPPVLALHVQQHVQHLHMHAGTRSKNTAKVIKPELSNKS